MILLEQYRNKTQTIIVECNDTLDELNKLQKNVGKNT